MTSKTYIQRWPFLLLLPFILSSIGTTTSYIKPFPITFLFDLQIMTLHLALHLNLYNYPSDGPPMVTSTSYTTLWPLQLTFRLTSNSVTSITDITHDLSYWSSMVTFRSYIILHIDLNNYLSYFYPMMTFRS